jgi:hypothetical protein
VNVMNEDRGNNECNCELCKLSDEQFIDLLDRLTPWFEAVSRVLRIAIQAGLIVFLIKSIMHKG